MTPQTNQKPGGFHFITRSKIQQFSISQQQSTKAAAILALWAVIPIAYVLQGQDSNWDLQNYHLYNTILFFEDRLSTDVAPAGMQSYYNPLVSIPAYLIHRVATTSTESFWYGFALASFQGLCGPIVFALTQFILPVSAITAFCITLFGLTSPMLLSGAGSSMADLTICVFQVASLYLCLRSLPLSNAFKSRFLAMGWGLFGAACAIKFSAIFSLPIVLIISLISLWETGQSTPHRGLPKQFLVAIVLPWLLGFTIFGWFWFQRSWADNGNPLYPLFSSIFGESRIFTTDNHQDQRFVVDGLLEYFTAPFMEFINTPNQRAEIPYRDMRPMLSIYLSALSLVLVVIGLARQTLFRQQTSHRRFLTLIGLQLGLIVSYVIWMREAGIARYTMHSQILSGVYVYISLLIVSKTELILKGQPIKSLKLESVAANNRMIAVFSGLLALSIITTQIPNWGRVSFDVRWNTLKPLGSEKDFSSTNYLLDANDGSLQKSPVVLVDKPLGWLKQYSPNGTHFSLVDDYLKADILTKIKSTITAADEHFIAIGLVDQNKLSPRSQIALAKNNFLFDTHECKDYMTPNRIQIRACQASLDLD